MDTHQSEGTQTTAVSQNKESEVADSSNQECLKEYHVADLLPYTGDGPDKRILIGLCGKNFAQQKHPLPECPQ
jgi:hypothetical protein